MADADERFHGIAAELAAIVYFAPLVARAALLLRFCLAVYSLAERLRAEFDGQDRKELDLPLCLVRRLRRAAAAAEADTRRLVADVPERARGGVVAGSHAPDAHVAAGERTAGPYRPALGQPPVSAAGAGAHVRVTAARAIGRLEARALARSLSPPPEVFPFVQLARGELVANQVRHAF